MLGDCVCACVRVVAWNRRLFTVVVDEVARVRDVELSVGAIPIRVSVALAWLGLGNRSVQVKSSHRDFHIYAFVFSNDDVFQPSHKKKNFTAGSMTALWRAIVEYNIFQKPCT